MYTSVNLKSWGPYLYSGIHERLENTVMTCHEMNKEKLMSHSASIHTKPVSNQPACSQSYKIDLV